MTAVTVKGLAALRRRLNAAASSQDFADGLRREAEAMAEAARAQAPGELAQSIEVRDESRGERPMYKVGTAHPAGRYLEFGTARRPASPWLLPLFWARSHAIKERLGKIVGSALRGL